MITNTWFYLRYKKLDRQSPSAILGVQSKLYRAKMLVDICVVIALSTLVVAPESAWAGYLDALGSVAVAAYLILTGWRTVRGENKKAAV